MVGTSTWAADVAQTAKEAPNVPFTVVGIVDDDPWGGGRLPASPRLGDVADLSRIVEAQRPTLIVLAEGAGSGRALESLLDVGIEPGFKVVGVTHFFEHMFGWVRFAI